MKSDVDVPPLQRSDGTFATTGDEKANILNDFFASVFTVDDGNVPHFNKRNPPNKFLNSVPFSYHSVLSALKKLPSKTSKSPDKYPALFLKSIADEIAIPLCFLFELSMKTGQIPTVWKKAIVIPVYKKGPSSLANNYRPISLTSICCKVMETVVKNSMFSFLLANKLISSLQHGFLVDAQPQPNS